MIKPNWDIFKRKFSDNSHGVFEWFCYLLFCKEFKKDKGIFRYKNQSAIETDPIEEKNEVIGWQAKFYETSLSSHKKELIDTLEKAKRDYPNITKIIFYTNQEWGQDKGKKPQGLEEIETIASKLNIKLEWRTASFFESPFVCIENEIIAKYFFSDKSIFDLIDELEKHTERILNQIRTTFNFKNQEFYIDRNAVLEELKNTKSQIIILSGVAGVGKTAVVKMYYEHKKNEMPFYVFNATEFNNLRNINEFFKNFELKEFIEAHKDEEEKIIVIDSAEKILDIKNLDPFKEFLKDIINGKWKIIFTIRDNYVEFLNTELLERYNKSYINIQNLLDKELLELSEKYEFDLPTDKKLIELIKNPFYLNEYLKSYKEGEFLDYLEFKKKLWIKIINKSKPKREQCFLKIAFEKANNGLFYINPGCETSVLDELLHEGILGYESPYGYFITHDIYEEWALEKITEREFLNKSSIEEFFEKIGSSLPIRRSFRNWLSEKLILNDKNINQFIENAISSGIPDFWKDEILISVLLSDYSEYFFEIFKHKLLKNNHALLKKITFLLRLACKEVDSDFLKQLGLRDLSISILIYVNKPKGKGWESFIKFIFNNIESIGFENIDFILSVIHDWNTKFKTGETTRYASLIALKYYQWIIKKDLYFNDNETKRGLLQTILYGTSEIKDELKEIFEEILNNKWKHHRDPYYDLVKMILVPNIENKFAGIEVVKALPEYVLKLVDLFWTDTPNNDENLFYNYSIIDIEQYFGLEKTQFDYFPESAYQTPVYWLLLHLPKETIDFILDFTNRSIRHYANSNYDPSVRKVKVYFDDGTAKEQYVSHCLWNMYRGTSSPVSPYLLQSIHMALEKYFLEVGKKLDSKSLESWLIYLLKNSESASISAVVASVVLAYPDKTFNVAKILFKTKEFILQDKIRLVSELNNVKFLYSIGYGLNSHHKIYQDERIKTCDDKHRKWSLEELFLYYQTFRSEEISEKEVKVRQDELWKILDDYYNRLPDKTKETEVDKIWRLFLARMDRRKMKVTTEQVNEGIAIRFEPELEQELKEFSEESLAKNKEFIKYIPLKLWASYKIKNEEKYKDYKQYEENPKKAFEELKEFINEINENKSEEFYLFNYSIRADVCATLLKYHIDILSNEEKEFCKKITLEFASLSLKTDYQFHILDGVESAISVLPILFKEFPDERENIKKILLLTLFNPHHIAMDTEFADFPTRAIKNLFSISFEDAQSLLLGYIYLKSKYEALRKKMLKENYLKNHFNQIKEYELIDRFKREYEKDLKKVLSNEISYEDLKEIETLDLYILGRSFQLIPEGTVDEVQRKIAKRIIDGFVSKVLVDDRESRINYKVKHKFLQKYAYFVLNLPKNKINEYLQPFIHNFNVSETIAELFEEFIYAEDILKEYDNFWIIWESFKEKVFEICKKREKNSYININKIIKSYLFATVLWNENVKEWHTLKNSNSKFFKEISQKIGHCPSTLYAFTKLLNSVGSIYIDDGIDWFSNIIENNKDVLNQKIDSNTIYYLEDFIKKFINNNYDRIKKTKDIKHKILIILDFLINKNSTIAYELREYII